LPRSGPTGRGSRGKMCRGRGEELTILCSAKNGPFMGGFRRACNGPFRHFPHSRPKGSCSADCGCGIFGRKKAGRKAFRKNGAPPAPRVWAAITEGLRRCAGCSRAKSRPQHPESDARPPRRAFFLRTDSECFLLIFAAAAGALGRNSNSCGRSLARVRVARGWLLVGDMDEGDPSADCRHENWAAAWPENEAALKIIRAAAMSRAGKVAGRFFWRRSGGLLADAIRPSARVIADFTARRCAQFGQTRPRIIVSDGWCLIRVARLIACAGKAFGGGVMQVARNSGLCVGGYSRAKKYPQGNPRSSTRGGRKGILFVFRRRAGLDVVKSDTIYVARRSQ